MEALATFEDTENSLTPLRRTMLLRRQMATERVTKRARERALALQAGLRKLLHPDDPRHILDPGGYEDDLRGLVNPDGSIHLWPIDEETHRSRAVRLNLLDRFGDEGIHFYLNLGEDDISGSRVPWREEDLLNDIRTILNKHGIMAEAAAATSTWNRREPTPSPPEPYDPDPFGFDGADNYYPVSPPPPPKITWWDVVTLMEGTRVTSVAGATSEKAWDEAEKREARAQAMGLKVKYIVRKRIPNRMW